MRGYGQQVRIIINSSKNTYATIRAQYIHILSVFLGKWFFQSSVILLAQFGQNVFSGMVQRVKLQSSWVFNAFFKNQIKDINLLYWQLVLLKFYIAFSWNLVSKSGLERGWSKVFGWRGSFVYAIQTVCFGDMSLIFFWKYSAIYCQAKIRLLFMKFWAVALFRTHE